MTKRPEGDEEGGQMTKIEKEKEKNDKRITPTRKERVKERASRQTNAEE